MANSPTPHPTGHAATPSTFDATSKLVAFFIGVLSVVAGIVIGLNNPFLNHAASTQGVSIDRLFSILLGICTTVFVIVQGFLVYSIVRFGGASADSEDGPPIRGNARLEVIWTAIPAIVVVFIALYSYQVLADIERPRSDELVIEVTGRQYAWEFYYPEQDLKTADLHIPLDRQVLLKMRSMDVIHAFWVPAFRIKKDVMPDRVTEARITGSEVGAYPLVCAELCGASHWTMRSQVVVQPDAEYQAWLASQVAAKGRAPVITDPLVYGRQLFAQYTCNACHALTDAKAISQVGPNLDGLGSRAATTVAGQSAEEYVRTAIVKANTFIVKGYQPVMPQDYGQRMSEAELNALVAYLLSQK